MSAEARSPVVAVDVNGADDPSAAVAGVLRAAENGTQVLLFGDPASVGAAQGHARVEVVSAPVSIAKDPDPARAVRNHRDASVVQAAVAVAESRADALVSGGSTGAALAAGLFNVKRAKGIHRPALAVPLPIPGAAVTLLDVGANDVCRPEHLVQFASMGAALASAVLGVDKPRVGLLSNGTEDTKGREEVVEAHARLSEAARGGADAYTFVGNVEGFDITAGIVDVLVTDGFTGNVTLKVMEGVSKGMIGYVRDAAMSSTTSKIGGALLRPALRGLRDDLDPEAQGGAYLLGLRKLAIVPHGSFGAAGWERAVERAALGVREDVIGRTYASLESAGALRRAPASDASDAVTSV
ncbi:MAG TPA: phosphate acyltransferase PlsX [Solirubrobacteraceae bacterium]|nr:phosphate acyltransferase PlsX [Solirubrobacteraceae bacterium]